MKKFSKLLSSLFIILIVLQLVQAKVYKETISLQKLKKEKGFHYLTKMAMDREWQQLDQSLTCAEKQKEQRTHRSKKSINLKNTEKIRWGKVKAGTVSQPRNRRVWFFALAACDLEQINQVIKENRGQGIKIEIELTLLNNQSHFGSDEIGFIWPIGFILFFYIGILLYGIQYIIKQNQKIEEIDVPLIVILSALGLSIFSLFFQLIHQISYSYNGQGLFVLDLFSEMTEVLSTFLLSVFLLLVSWGWTINYMELDSFDVIVPLAILMGIIDLMIMGLGKLTDNSDSKYHLYDGWVGYVILVIQIGLFIYFQFGLNNIKQKASIKLKSFIQQLSFFGSLYFLAIPILLVISWFFAFYDRNIIITLGTLLIQAAAFIVLIYLNTSQKSAYYKVSMKSQGILPGGRL
ncbi:hypothetical protein PPERSA_05746 [Pseudocohnilembus persalinus]|uniref:GPR180/TMEM145 transmembrane domain-containing protein n=1 Tax=Pseudocohnilembus persalinus TaxID=266149 RepID=A0A0V0QHZ3_PSEPJ|nr:hypothetical protein PPERSA_05746 [Pseudocohnilembus persalinus]|eukprot:KRX01907.1 hypothetical protein PPERSA_05746 [Pseudocohnilembus persalinus]